MKKWKMMIKILVVFLFIFAGTSVTTAEEGVTDTSVKIGSHMDLSGVIAYWGNNLRMGIQSYYNHVNEEGGVHGRKINFVVII